MPFVEGSLPGSSGVKVGCEEIALQSISAWDSDDNLVNKPWLKTLLIWLYFGYD